jgi:hypothetical protein
MPPAALIRVVNLTPTKLKGALTVAAPFLVASRPVTASKACNWANVYVRVVLPSTTVSVVGAAAVVVVVAVVVDVVVPVVVVVTGVVVVVVVVLNVVVGVVKTDVVVVDVVAALPQDAATNDRASKGAQSPVSHLILLGNLFCIVSPCLVMCLVHAADYIIYFGGQQC